jgi:Rieske Fe-S protein
MSGDDQERFEDYLELERFIAELQAGHIAHPPQELTPTQARVYRMATLFHAATPGVAEPDLEFAAQLQSRLEAELQAMQEKHGPPAKPIRSSSPRRHLSRRAILTGSAAVAASVTIGAGVGHMADMAMHRMADPSIVVKVTTPTDWFAVTSEANVGSQAVKFRVETQGGSPLLTGYIVRSDGTNGQASEKGALLAMSAACTHKGCIVDWSGDDRRFHCPCHGGVFTQDGGIDDGKSALTYIQPLPALEVRVENGQVQVRIPEENAPTSDTTPDSDTPAKSWPTKTTR